MSLRDTRDIGTAKIVMLGGGGGGGSYSAGSGISISNSVITNIRKGALTGVVDSISSNIAHTQITGARDTFAAGALILLQSEAAGTANNLRIQYGAQSSDSQTFAIYDTSGTAASVTIASGDTVIMMIDNTGYRAIILNVLSASGGSSYAGLGIGKKKTVTNNIIDTDIDLHRAPVVGDRLLLWFDESVSNPTGIKTYNNGTAVTGDVESVSPLTFNNGWNVFEYKSFLGSELWSRVQNVPIPNNTLSGLSDTLISSNPSSGQVLMVEDNKWKNKNLPTVEANPSGSAVRELKGLQIGSVVYNADGLKCYDISSISSGNITVHVPYVSQLNGEVIAVHSGALSGSYSSGWTLVLSDGQTVEALSMLRASGADFDDDISGNSLMIVKCDTSADEAIVLSVSGVDDTVQKTVSGNPITLTDAIAGNALEVSAEIVASQDLHGYDKPWVGGAGKNKMPLTISTLKSANTGGTWNGNVYVYGGVTFTVLTDSDDNVVGIKTDGAPNNGNISFYLTAAFNAVSGETYTISGSPSGKSYNTFRIFPVSATAFAAGNRLSDDTAEDATRTAAGNETVTFYIQIFNGVNVDNRVFYPQIEIGTQATAFAPYSNICPITGFSSVVITDVDSESHTATVTVSLGQTVYGGTLDLTSGELTITHANIASYNGETINVPWISSMDEYTQGGTPTTGAQVVYTLATPTTTTLTAAQLALVKGYNQLTCNSGDMSITYKASGLDALKERVDDLEDRVDDVESELTVMSKTRYTITSSSWSASANASGYYTYSLTLTTLLSTSYAPNVYISGASDSAFPTDTEKAQFSYLDECNLSASNTLVLYAKTKPTSTFYVYVEGQNA